VAPRLLKGWSLSCLVAWQLLRIRQLDSKARAKCLEILAVY
jgi:hypothetical protein